MAPRGGSMAQMKDRQCGQGEEGGNVKNSQQMEGIHSS